MTTENPHHPARPKALVLSAAIGLLTLPLNLPAQTVPPPSTPPGGEVSGELEEFVGYGGEDPNFVMPNQPIEGAIGFSKTLVETPRSASVISSEMIASLSINEVSDLSRITPSANTTTRWGVQGNIDIRNMTADTYFRGMKRIEPQGNSRTVLGANDQIEVIRGPAPAYFGSGKIGGYTNLTPKSGRSRQGAYLTDDEGFIQFVGGQYGKREVSFGYGGPLNVGLEDRRGGFYIYGLIEDSESFYKTIDIGQRVLQGAISQEITKNWRVESGINYQETHTAGGFLNRVTQELVDDGVYWGGRALVNLDTDSSGKISEREMVLGSPIGSALGAPNVGASGTLGANNRALQQRFKTGRYATALTGAVPVLANANAGSALLALRTSGAAGNTAATNLLNTMYADTATYGNNLKLLNVLPQGFVFDPATMVQTEANYQHVALEKELLAKLGLFYLDFVNDKGENLKLKNQILFDSQDQFKDSELPFYQKQDVWVVEDKFTAEYSIPEDKLPEWISINTITSVNVRHTDASRRFNSGDYDDRPDLALAGNVRTPYDLFVSPRENDDYFNGGAPFSGDINTVYTEYGAGTMVDVTFWDRLNILGGARVDYIDAETTVPAGLYSIGTNGVFTTPGSAAVTSAQGKGDDIGRSWNLSASYKTPFGIIPYVTVGRQTALSDGADLTLAGNLVTAGPYDSASIEEVGIKGSHFKEKFYWAVAAYRQERSTVVADINGNPLAGGLGNVKGEGIELETRWVPSKNFWVSAFAVFQETTLVATSGNVRVHGEPLGFSDVLDPVTGQVLYPAEAFTWGGQASIAVGPNEYIDHPAYPETTYGLASEYSFNNGLSIGASGNYISAIHSGRLQTVMLPEALTFNANITYRFGKWRGKLDVFNVTDELWFRGRNGATAGDVLISAMPGRRWQVSVSRTF